MRKLAVAIALAVLAGVTSVQAQTYPSRQITLIVPFPPGGSTDVAARILAEHMRARLGQPVVIENVGGAGGSIAAAYVAKAAPDGYTLLLSGDAPLVTNVSLYDKLAYDPVNDLAPISQLIATPNVLVVPIDLPVKSVAELIALGPELEGYFRFYLRPQTSLAPGASSSSRARIPRSRSSRR